MSEIRINRDRSIGESIGSVEIVENIDFDIIGGVVVKLYLKGAKSSDKAVIRSVYILYTGDYTKNSELYLDSYTEDKIDFKVVDSEEKDYIYKTNSGYKGKYEALFDFAEENEEELLEKSEEAFENFAEDLEDNAKEVSDYIN